MKHVSMFQGGSDTGKPEYLFLLMLGCSYFFWECLGYIVGSRTMYTCGNSYCLGARRFYSNAFVCLFSVIATTVYIYIILKIR